MTAPSAKLCHDLSAEMRISSSRTLPNFSCKFSPDAHEHRHKGDFKEW